MAQARERKSPPKATPPQQAAATQRAAHSAAHIALPADIQQLQIAHLHREADQRLQQVALDVVANAIVITDPSGMIRWVNPAFCRLTGYSAAEAIGQSTRILRSGGQTESYYHELWETISAGRVWHGELLNRRKDGSLYVEEQTITPVRGGDGQINHYIAIKQDVTERTRRARELEALSIVSSALRSASSRAEMLPVILEQVCDLLHADGALIASIKGDEIWLELGYGTLTAMSGLHAPAGAGVIGYVIGTSQPFHTAHLWQEPLIAHMHLGHEQEALAAAPLSVEGVTLGTLVVNRTVRAPNHKTYFSEAEQRLLMAIADMAASALHRTQLHEQTQLRLQRLQALHSVNIAISTSLDLSITLGVLLDHVIGQLQVDAAAIFMFNPQSLRLEFAAGRGFHSCGIEQTSIGLDEPAAGKAVIERRSVGLLDLHSSPHILYERKLEAESFAAYYNIPLIAKGYIRGVIEVFGRSRWKVDAEWEELLHILASQATVAIDNTSLFESLQRSNMDLTLAYDATIEGWSRALDLRDSETEGHSQRVTALTVRLASALQVGEEEMTHIRRGALLHDIGKMGVPDAILLKPGPLNDHEWAEMRRHPTYAYEMLRPIAYLRSALDIPRYHHERWDGGGYPYGLQAEAIPLAARIFAVADVWDALRSDRPYRKAWEASRVREYITAHAGTLFDPMVVQAFLALEL